MDVISASSLSVISGRVSQMRRESSRKGDPRTIMGSGGHSAPRLEMKGTTMPHARATVELRPEAWWEGAQFNGSYQYFGPILSSHVK